MLNSRLDVSLCVGSGPAYQMSGPAFSGRQLSMDLSMVSVGKMGSTRNRTDGRTDRVARKTWEAGALLCGLWKVPHGRVHMIE